MAYASRLAVSMRSPPRRCHNWCHNAISLANNYFRLNRLAVQLEAGPGTSILTGAVPQAGRGRESRASQVRFPLSQTVRRIIGLILPVPQGTPVSAIGAETGSIDWR